MLKEALLLEANAAIDKTPLTPEEAIALMRGALGADQCTGMLLAVSGGPDSITMMGLAGAARAFLPPLAIATVNHGLREEAQFEADAVADFAAELGLPHCTLHWQDRPQGPVSQEAARKGRYALLAGHARAIEASHLVTAHTLDDQAETVLLRLTGGTGTAGLGAMRHNIRRGAVGHLRPFLDIPKSRIIATAERNGWLFSSDPSNEDTRFKRVRLRALMPLLANEGLTTERLGTLAARARRTEEAIELLARRGMSDLVTRKAPDGGAVRLMSGPFLSEPFELALRMLRQAMFSIGTEEQQGSAIPLGKLEIMLRNLRMAIRDDRPFRSTLAWSVVAYGGGYIELRTAPPRRQARGGR